MPLRATSRWLYVAPMVLLLAACWTYSDQARGATSDASNSFADEVVFDDESMFPLEPVTDQDDLRRFIRVEGDIVEDTATGIRRKVQRGLTLAEGFEAAGETVIGLNGRPTAGRGVSASTRTSNSVASPANDLRLGIGPRPGRLIVESIGVNSEVMAIGVDRNRALLVPRRADVAGWWSGGAVPGERGPTVIVGHYDSRSAAGVFARLTELETGDLIVVSQTDGSLYTYFVTKVERLKKSAFPTKRVYGSTSETALRLVTCGGKFDRSTGHYVENTIAYAELLSFVPSPWPAAVPPFPGTESSVEDTPPERGLLVTAEQPVPTIEPSTTTVPAKTGPSINEAPTPASLETSSSLSTPTTGLTPTTLLTSTTVQTSTTVLTSTTVQTSTTVLTSTTGPAPSTVPTTIVLTPAPGPTPVPLSTTVPVSSIVEIIQPLLPSEAESQNVVSG